MTTTDTQQGETLGTGFICECCQRQMELRIDGKFCNECYHSRRAAVTGPRSLFPQGDWQHVQIKAGNPRVVAIQFETAEQATQFINAFAFTSSPTPAESDLYRVASRVLRWLYATMNPKLPIDRSLLKVTQFEIHAELERAILDTHAANIRACIAPPESTRVEGEQLGHVDFTFDNTPCCKVCGLVRPAEGWTRPCKGPHGISLRETSDSARRAAWADAGGHAWEIRSNVECVECPHCAFTFAAMHTVAPEDYDCPNCEGCPDAAAPVDNDAKRLRWLLKRIIADLPKNRDWLDPDVEEEARELTTTKGDR